MVLKDQLTAKFGDLVTPSPSIAEEEVYLVDRSIIAEACQFVKEAAEPRFDFLMDLTAVDYLKLNKTPRFAVIYNFYSSSSEKRVRFKVGIPEADVLLPTVTHLWHTANWLEREVWDMFGIKFKGHPDLRRLLMYDEFKGHPLRKDYPFSKRQPLVRSNEKYEDHEIKAYLNRVAEEDKKLNIESVTGSGNVDTINQIAQTSIDGDRSQHSFLMNMGPSHPAMHGVIHMLLELDGESVYDVDVGIGYLHRAFEKECEVGPWSHAFPFTDRLNYVSPLINNVGYAEAVEKALGLEITERAKYIRVIMSEISRITDHLTCVGANAMELGAMSAFLYFIEAREELWDLVEEITGARLTVSYVRVGGVKADLTEAFPARCRRALKFTREKVKEMHKLLTRNRIFVDRMKGTGAISKELAISYGFTGPVLRSTGVDMDVRKYNPYLVYDKLDFDVPYGQYGDNYDRYLVRMEEIEQSISIIEQCLDQIPAGPINVDHEGVAIPEEQQAIMGAQYADRGKFGQTDGLLQIQALTDPTLSGGNGARRNTIFPDDKRVVLPAKEKTYGSIEGVMNHFMLIMDGHGVKPPPGEVYAAVEGANGELGFFIVSNGEDRPYRVHCRPPCFQLMSGLAEMLKGDQVADIIATFGTINMIAGELDR